MPNNFKNRSVDASRHAMVPRADVPRSSFKTTSSHKTTFNAGTVVPIYCDEVLPGDSHSVRLTAFLRLGTVLFPVMDNLHFDTFWFYVPSRLVWENFTKMMGEQLNPTSTTSYLSPEVVSPSNGWAVGSIADYFGLPTVGQVGSGLTVTHSVLPLRAYYLIWNEWFRDQNLQDSAVIPVNDGPDANTIYNYEPMVRAKRPDYFTTCLPWPQKPTSLDATQAFQWQGTPGTYDGALYSGLQVGVPVTGLGAQTLTAGLAGPTNVYETGSFVQNTYAALRGKQLNAVGNDNNVFMRIDSDGTPDVRVTINAIRTAFQVQRLLERDARGGTRYTEQMQSHFGVRNPDSRLQRPEYLGGGSSPINVSPVSQQSATGQTGSTTPLGHLSATVQGVSQGHGFSQSFVEHGWIIGLACVRADLTYYWGLHKMWFRRSKFDYYWPAFAQLGEQAVRNREIFMDGSAADNSTFGFQERWSEYRSKPGQVTGRFRGSAASTLDAWHLAQRFATHPTLGATFIADGTEVVLDRVLAAGSVPATLHEQILFDGFFDVRRVRPIPAFSTPGLVDHF